MNNTFTQCVEFVAGILGIMVLIVLGTILLGVAFAMTVAAVRDRLQYPRLDFLNMTKPLRNEDVEHNTREAFRCLKQWQIFASCLWVLFILLAVVLIIVFWPTK
jgi:hypothetical protein